jgi:hypothetical protein
VASSFSFKVLQRGRVWRFGWIGAIGLAAVAAGAAPARACYGSECVGQGVAQGTHDTDKATRPVLERGAYDVWATVLESAYAVGYTFGKVAQQTGRLAPGVP